MLKERILSAIVMVIAVLAAIFLLSPLPLTIIVTVVVSLGMWEWAQFVGFKTPVSRMLIALVTGQFYCC